MSEDVLLAVQDDTVIAEVVLAPRELQGPGPVRGRVEGLRAEQDRGPERGRQRQLTAADGLRLPEDVEPGAREQALHLVGRGVRVLLVDEGRGTRQDRRRFRRA